MQVFYFHRHVGSVLVQHWQHLLGSLLVFTSIHPCFNQNLTEPVRRKGWKELLEAFQRGVYRISSLSIVPRQREGQGRAGQGGCAAEAAGSWIWLTGTWIKAPQACFCRFLLGHECNSCRNNSQGRFLSVLALSRVVFSILSPC